MNQTSFDQLLSCLGSDRESAASAYLELRRALFTYFTIRGAVDSDHLADETFDRVARRLSEGQTIITESPANYFYGVARNVWRESLAQTGKIPLPTTDEAGAELASAITPHDLLIESIETAESEKRLACLKKCLTQFSAEDRELVIGYYRETGGEKIENRKAMADALGISLDSLRHRLARLRIKLGSSIEQCLKSR